MTLTILTTMKPELLIKKSEYKIEKINAWKYESRWIPYLPIYILVQKEMRYIKGGEALVLLQILEGDKNRQKQSWQEILSQNLNNSGELKKFIEKINKETYMNLVEELKKEGRKEGEIRGEIKVLSWFNPEKAKKYQDNIKLARTNEQFLEIEEQVKRELKELLSKNTEGR